MSKSNWWGSCDNDLSGEKVERKKKWTSGGGGEIQRNPLRQTTSPRLPSQRVPPQKEEGLLSVAVAIVVEDRHISIVVEETRRPALMPFPPSV